MEPKKRNDVEDKSESLPASKLDISVDQIAAQEANRSEFQEKGREDTHDYSSSEDSVLQNYFKELQKRKSTAKKVEPKIFEVIESARKSISAPKIDISLDKNEAQSSSSHNSISLRDEAENKVQSGSNNRLSFSDNVASADIEDDSIKILIKISSLTMNQTGSTHSNNQDNKTQSGSNKRLSFSDNVDSADIEIDSPKISSVAVNQTGSTHLNNQDNKTQSGSNKRLSFSDTVGPADIDVDSPKVSSVAINHTGSTHLNNEDNKTPIGFLERRHTGSILSALDSLEIYTSSDSDIFPSNNDAQKTKTRKRSSSLSKRRSNSKSRQKDGTETQNSPESKPSGERNDIGKNLKRGSSTESFKSVFSTKVLQSKKDNSEKPLQLNHQTNLDGSTKTKSSRRGEPPKAIFYSEIYRPPLLEDGDQTLLVYTLERTDNKGPDYRYNLNKTNTVLGTKTTDPPEKSIVYNHQTETRDDSNVSQTSWVLHYKKIHEVVQDKYGLHYEKVVTYRKEYDLSDFEDYLQISSRYRSSSSERVTEMTPTASNKVDNRQIVRRRRVSYTFAGFTLNTKLILLFVVLWLLPLFIMGIENLQEKLLDKCRTDLCDITKKKSTNLKEHDFRPKSYKSDTVFKSKLRHQLQPEVNKKDVISQSKKGIIYNTKYNREEKATQKLQLKENENVKKTRTYKAEKTKEQQFKPRVTKVQTREQELKDTPIEERDCFIQVLPNWLKLFLINYTPVGALSLKICTNPNHPHKTSERVEMGRSPNTLMNAAHFMEDVNEEIIEKEILQNSADAGSMKMHKPSNKDGKICRKARCSNLTKLCIFVNSLILYVFQWPVSLINPVDYISFSLVTIMWMLVLSFFIRTENNTG